MRDRPGLGLERSEVAQLFLSCERLLQRFSKTFRLCKDITAHVDKNLTLLCVDGYAIFEDDLCCSVPPDTPLFWGRGPCLPACLTGGTADGMCPDPCAPHIAPGVPDSDHTESGQRCPGP